MKKRLYLKNKNLIFRCADIFISNQSGAILITLIVSMVVVAGLGSAMVSMFATSTYNQFGSSNSMMAYYLAEAGRKYAIQYANNVGDVTNAALSQTFTFSNGDNFTISNATWVDIMEFSFKSTGTTSGGISRVLDYNRVAGGDLATDPAQGVKEGGACCEDEAFDNDCQNKGYRSNKSGPNVKNSGAYIGYDFNVPTQILRVWLSQDEKIIYQIRDIKVQGSNNSDFSTIGGETTIIYSKGNYSPSDPCADGDFQSFDLPADLGTYRYWRLLADAEPNNGRKWIVNELRFFGVAETQT